ncbi:PaaI family thioesterase [Roseomonas sp. OT10]|uniref:PaaI family thioesterase n=1 Tax=Roseomonas cutis TaxID=2897332 RepID=UPI001E3269F2|nr:PaaI family thioesterase [Roseomonas sp. OT10]UFN48755.1 PaaI family thioesterase [Roseomonas sp. OT10]
MAQASAPLWRRRLTAEDLNRGMADTLSGLLGMRVTAVEPDRLLGEMPVDSRHVQPWRILHGGASVALAETLGSLACYMALPEGRRPVGLEINANHLSAVPEGGVVTAECRPLHVGRSTQVWQTEIRRADGRLVCVSRITCAVLDDPSTPAASDSA